MTVYFQSYMESIKFNRTVKESFLNSESVESAIIFHSELLTWKVSDVCWWLSAPEIWNY